MMKRVKAACIYQTLVFSQKPEAGYTHEQALRLNRDEIAHYRQTPGADPHQVPDHRRRGGSGRLRDSPCPQAVQ